MKIRNTHCVELVLSAAELAKALGHESARVREAEVKLKDGSVEAVRVHLEYVIATRGVPRRERRTSLPVSDDRDL